MSIRKYKPNQKVRGKVTGMDGNGAFIQLEPNVFGFLPLAELSWTRKINRPSEVLEIGMEIDTIIISTTEEDQSLCLSHRQLEPNPWDEMHLRYPSGRPVRGVVSNIRPEGATIVIEEGIEGVIDFRELSEKDFKEGQAVETWVVGVNKDTQRIALSLREPQPRISKRQVNISNNKSTKIKLHMCESWITYANKGQVDIDIAYFPLLKEKTKEEVAKWVTENAKDLWIDQNSGIIFPSQTTTKEEYIKENELDVDITAEDLEDEGWEGEYKDENRVSLWSYFNEASINFEKIKNEEHFFSSD